VAVHTRLKIPDQCRFCEAVGKVVLESTIKGSIATIDWCCTRCQRTWPIAEEDAERRVSAERRKTSRNDRRKRS
jgi:hypothetical protein